MEQICTNVSETGNLYGHWQIAPDTWCITDCWKNFMYLLIGKDRAMLIDTGCGEGNIRKAVEQITDKPIMTVNTHGHFDHTGGNPCWPDAWMTEEAAVYAKEPFDSRYREWFLSKPYPDYKIHYVRDKERIELGEREVEVLAIPAHSEGSIALLDSKTRFLFSGDELESGQVIWFVRNNPIPVRKLAALHKCNMEKLLAYLPKYDFIWPAHNGAPLFPEPYLQDFIALDQKIMEGTQEIKETTAGFGFPPDHKKTENLFRDYGKLFRAEYGLASVVYADGASVYRG